MLNRTKAGYRLFSFESLDLSKRVLPGLKLSLGITLLYVAVIIALPLIALVLKAAGLGFADYWAIISSPRAVSSYLVTASSSLIATAFNLVFGLALAWVLVRYHFPGRRLLDAIVDLPFALPTAVAGIALVTLLSDGGSLDKMFASLGFSFTIKDMGLNIAYTPLGIIIAMAFTSLPFVVRTVQPVLEDLDPTLEEAGQSLGAGDGEVFIRVLLPQLMPALLTGLALSFARGLGEYGAIIFIAGNKPFETEITALLIAIRLDEYEYGAAAAIASVLLVTAFTMLVVTNIAQNRALRYLKRS